MAAHSRILAWAPARGVTKSQLSDSAGIALGFLEQPCGLGINAVL